MNANNTITMAHIFSDEPLFGFMMAKCLTTRHDYHLESHSEAINGISTAQCTRKILTRILDP